MGHQEPSLLTPEKAAMRDYMFDLVRAYYAYQDARIALEGRARALRSPEAN